MTSEVKISVVIPTRSRAEYLQGCIESALVSASMADCPVEIIVSDNASTDDTEDVVRGFESKLITYVRQPARVSMRQNFEDALSYANGSHVVFIGDDDGIMPSGLHLLHKLVTTHDPDVVKWSHAHFTWPDDGARTPGHLLVRYRKHTGRISWIDHRSLRNRFFEGNHQSYSYGACIYHGCISRRLIEKVKTAGKGTYFWCSAPDVYASIANLLANERNILKVDWPISIGGASPRSNGKSCEEMARTGKPGAEIGKFIRESGDDPCRSRISDECMSIQLHLLAALEMACRFQGVPFDINRENWKKVIGRELTDFSPEMVACCVKDAEALLGDCALSEVATGKAQPTRPATDTMPRSAPSEPGTMAKVPQSISQSLTRVTIRGGEHMADVARAAAFLDDILENQALQNTLRPPLPLLSILRMRKNLRKYMRP